MLLAERLPHNCFAGCFSRVWNLLSDGESCSYTRYSSACSEKNMGGVFEIRFFFLMESVRFRWHIGESFVILTIIVGYWKCWYAYPFFPYMFPHAWSFAPAKHCGTNTSSTSPCPRARTWCPHFRQGMARWDTAVWDANWEIERSLQEAGAILERFGFRIPVRLNGRHQ